MRKSFNKSMLDAISKASFEYTGEFGLNNAKDNRKHVKTTIRDLKCNPKSGAIIISAGPSLYKKDISKVINENRDDYNVVVADAALPYCLRRGLIPDYVVTLDPHNEFILRWFGDPGIKSRKPTDYFKRQELDLEIREDEIGKNALQIELVDKHASKIKLIISSSVHVNVTERCIEAGFDMYWWNPIYDDWEQENSITKRVQKIIKAPCMVGGGNVGTASWIFAHTVLKVDSTALVGFDFSYPPGTEIYNTQRYHEMKEFFGLDNIDDGYVEYFNPYLDETWFTDPTYYWYREIFLEMAKFAGCKIYNCTEGGIIFGDGIIWTSLEDYFCNE